MHSVVLFQCDNISVVAAIKKGSSKDPLVMHLLRSLWFFVAYFDICLTVEHLAGCLNITADHLSRNNMQSFFVLNPQADPQQTPLPAELLQIYNSARQPRLDLSGIQKTVLQLLSERSSLDYSEVLSSRAEALPRILQPCSSIVPAHFGRHTAAFCWALGTQGLSHASIKVYLSAVRNLHVSDGLHE